MFWFISTTKEMNVEFFLLKGAEFAALSYNRESTKVKRSHQQVGAVSWYSRLQRAALSAAQTQIQQRQLQTETGNATIKTLASKFLSTLINLLGFFCTGDNSLPVSVILWLLTSSQNWRPKGAVQTAASQQRADPRAAQRMSWCDST